MVLNAVAFIGTVIFTACKCDDGYAPLQLQPRISAVVRRTYAYALGVAERKYPLQEKSPYRTFGFTALPVLTV